MLGKSNEFWWGNRIFPRRRFFLARDCTFASRRLKSSAEKVFRLSSLKALSFVLWAGSLNKDGIIETVTFSCLALRKTICVAKRVHRVLSRGKGSSVRPSKTEDFPLDWSPTTTSYNRCVRAMLWHCNSLTCGSRMYSLIPFSRKLSIFPKSTGSPSWLSWLEAIA